MRILALDRGNSSLKAALFEDGRLLAWSLDRKGNRIPHWEADLSVVSWVGARGPLPENLPPPISIIQAEKTGIPLGYGDPGSLGSDRVAALYGALRIYGPGCLVVDFGTAVTVDSLSFDGVHRGGGIFPGPDLILKSLNTGTSGVRAEGWSLLSRLGTTTRECVLSAITYALSGMVRGYLGELAPLPKLILTGGGCREWLPLFPEGVYDPFLVLKGLELYGRERL